MPPEDDNNDNNDGTNDDNNDSSSIVIDQNDPDPVAPTVAEQIQKGIDDALAPIKTKLDKSFELRDDALLQVELLKKEKREEELKRLEDEGKHTELAEAKLADVTAENATLKKTNTELTRDMSVKSALADYEFRNSSANDMAFRNITENLVQNEHGIWVHKSGETIADTVKEFLDDTENSFLLKAKRSSGSGSDDQQIDTSQGAPSGKLADMPVAEVLKLAEGGNLRKR
jgi:hypothetical protein